MCFISYHFKLGTFDDYTYGVKYDLVASLHDTIFIIINPKPNVNSRIIIFVIACNTYRPSKLSKHNDQN